MQIFNCLQLDLEGCNLDNGGFHMKRFGLWSKISIIISIWQITSLIRTSPESFNGSLLMMYF